LFCDPSGIRKPSSVVDATGRKVARLVRVARKALRNADLHRAAEVLEQIEELVGADFGGEDAEEA
jgi:hypothetical protein